MKREFTVKCKSCGKTFTVIEDEQKFPIKGDKYFCCRSCANKRQHSNETRKKISQALHLRNLTDPEIIKKKQLKEKYKYICGNKELDLANKEISRHRILKWFKNLIPFGFDYSTIHTANVINEYWKVKELLYNEYVVNMLSPSDIYKKYQCDKYINHSEVLLHIFKSFEFPIRGLSKAVSNAFAQGKLSNNDCSFGHEQWHTTWEGKDVFLRSNLEFNFAQYLDNAHIKYDVETLRIRYFDTQKQLERCAIPDFYLQETNTLVEIKASYTLDVQNMKDKFKAYKELGYNTKLILNNTETDLYSL